MTIAVTGASGQLGGLVLEELLKTQPADEVVAIARTPAKAHGIAALGVQVRAADYDDLASLDAALKDVDVLLLISSNAIGERVLQHQHVIDAAKAAGVSRLVYTSAPHALNNDFILAPEHKSTEEYISRSGLTFTIARHNWYTENYLPQIEAALQTGVLTSATGEGYIASATRADYAAGDAALLTSEGHENRVYEFSGDRAWNFPQLADALSSMSGKPIEFESLTHDEMVDRLAEVGVDALTAKFSADIDADIARGALAMPYPDLAHIIGRSTTTVPELLMQVAAAPAQVSPERAD